MGYREIERAAVRKLREALGLSRREFAKLVSSYGHACSEPSIESYEKEVPVTALHAFAKLARERNLIEIAEELQPSENPPSDGRYQPNPRNIDWHRKLDVVLEEGEIRDRQGIEQNLDWAVSSLRSRIKRKRGGK